MNKPDIIIMIGVSGSGKSTEARTYTSQGYTLVSRDDLRLMLFGYTPEDISEYYSRPGIQHREDLVTRIQDKIIRECLKNGGRIVVDNTHLKRKYLKVYDKYGKNVEYNLVDTPLETCIKRDKNRPDSVGEDVIRKQYQDLQTLKQQFLENIKQTDFST